ncbi:MAG TPA: 7-cyano-7-deazaguanine synthase QueC [Pseudobdellovibrionaceae bacterium]|nr:7-cyano-7-deazaguanine synthase QueC [Pseudobdellovibrionaceae bacterium]
MSEKSVVLLSSGLDSTVNFWLEAQKGRAVLALTFDYGQRAAPREIERARAIAELAGVRHQSLDLKWFRDFTRTSLVSAQMQVPTGADVQIDDFAQSTETAKSVWVPNRNGIFLSIAAAFAEGLGAKVIVPGFNLEEATTFPDNTQAYMESVTASLRFSTANQVRVECATVGMHKTEIVELGRQIKAPFHLMWPCYLGEAQACGECESCQRFKRAGGWK